METIKSYTDISQSKKLAKILPYESADMFHFIHEVDTVGFGYKEYIAKLYSETKFEYLPCWSLVALLNNLNESVYFANEAGVVELSSIKVSKWCVSVLNCGKIENCYADNPVDACYEMILKLHELNLLRL